MCPLQERQCEGMVWTDMYKAIVISSGAQIVRGAPRRVWTSFIAYTEKKCMKDSHGSWLRRKYNSETLEACWWKSEGKSKQSLCSTLEWELRLESRINGQKWATVPNYAGSGAAQRHSVHCVRWNGRWTNNKFQGRNREEWRGSVLCGHMRGHNGG